MAELIRCEWSHGQFEEYQLYHDVEWGVPIHEDNILFEFLILESAQAGLSWSTILKKREGYRKAFADFKPSQVAKFDESKIEELIHNPEIVRNKLKIRAAVKNAQLFIGIQEGIRKF